MRAQARLGAAPARHRLSAVLARHRVLAALGGGAVSALALSPFHVWPALLAFALLTHLLGQAERPRSALLLGWSFGFGHFLVGLYWVAIAFFTDAERYGALAIPAVLLLCAGMALYPALAAWAVALVRWRSAAARALALALAWTAGEGLRTVLFGGFPWNLIGYAWVGLPPDQAGALLGIYGLSLLSVAAGALPAALLEPGGRGRFAPAGAAALLVALLWAGGAWRLHGAEVDTVPEVRLRLVQGNVAQHHKWDPELRARWFRRHLELSGAQAAGVTHVIWPESATPYALGQDATAREMIGAVVPQGGLLLTGGERFDLARDPPRAWNSLYVLDRSGAILAHYDKARLVPFGEYVPFRAVLGRVGLGSLARGGLDFQAGPGAASLEVPGLPPFSPLICYEVIYSGQVVDRARRPAWLLNVTNDAWFGTSSGPYQHLAMARMRAIEEGLPLARAANTGISALVDPYGRVIARLGLGETGVVDGALPRPLAAPTPFARFGLVPLGLLAAALGALGLGLEAHARRRPEAVNKA